MVVFFGAPLNYKSKNFKDALLDCAAIELNIKKQDTASIPLDDLKDVASQVEIMDSQCLNFYEEEATVGFGTFIGKRKRKRIVS